MKPRCWIAESDLAAAAGIESSSCHILPGIDRFSCHMTRRSQMPALVWMKTAFHLCRPVALCRTGRGRRSSACRPGARSGASCCTTSRHDACWSPRPPPTAAAAADVTPTCAKARLGKMSLCDWIMPTAPLRGMLCCRILPETKEQRHPADVRMASNTAARTRKKAAIMLTCRGPPAPSAVAGERALVVRLLVQRLKAVASAPSPCMKKLDQLLFMKLSKLIQVCCKMSSIYLQQSRRAQPHEHGSAEHGGLPCWPPCCWPPR